MKSLFILAIALSSASAFARPSTTNMACADAAALVKAKGAIVLSTGAYTYDRFVAHAGYCGAGEKALGAWVNTADSDSCFIGYVCKNRGHR